MIYIEQQRVARESISSTHLAINNSARLVNHKLKITSQLLIASSNAAEVFKPGEYIISYPR